jgi:hypothetical protein
MQESDRIAALQIIRVDDLGKRHMYPIDVIVTESTRLPLLGVRATANKVRPRNCTFTALPVKK